MFSFHIRKLHTLLPLLTCGHLATEQLHHDVHPPDIIPHTSAEVSAETQGGPDAVTAIVLYPDRFLHGQTVGEDKVFHPGIYPQLFVAFDHRIGEYERVATVVTEAGEERCMLLAEVAEKDIGGVGIGEHRPQVTVVDVDPVLH